MSHNHLMSGDLMSEEQIIQTQWQRWMCPIFSGIVYGDGTIVQVEMQRSEPLTQIARVMHRSGIGEFVKNHPDDWTELISLCEVTVPERDYRLVAGEGGFGGDGFVALARNSDNHLIWIAFFDNSNPFIEVSINKDFTGIQGKTNLGTVWRFPIDRPENVQVIDEA